MARPKKEGLDYFPLDVDIDQDDKVVIIIAQYGIEGFGILIKLMMEIYKNGYFYNWTEKEQIIFSSRVNVSSNTIQSIVSDCIKWGLFNEDVFNNHHVLTSKGIQNRYLLATSRRMEASIKEEYRLVEVNVDINPKLPVKKEDINPQSKVKEKKVKETKNKYAEFVTLTDNEYSKLIEKFGEVDTKNRIERLNLYKGSKGINYKSDYMTILSWANKEEKSKPKPVEQPRRQEETKSVLEDFWRRGD